MRSLTILQLNDLHGYLAPHPELFRLAPNDRFRSGGGVARIAAIFQSIRREVDGATAPDAAMAHIVDHAVSAFAGAGAHVVGTTRTALDRYAMLESMMDNLLLDAIATAADRPIALSNGWRYGAPVPPGPLTELDLWNIVPTNPPVSVAAPS
jgi:2',3'-cyclic-nucleotide 2'-phosphodiesterase (5'-nucleotidase family)